MTTPSNHSDANSNAGSGAGAAPEVAPDQSTAHSADELFTHGLLTHLSHDTPVARDARVRRLMEAIASEGRARTLRFPAPLIRRALATAALIAITAGAVFFATRSEVSAQAVVNESIAALRANGDRRFEVRIMRDNESALPESPTATVDTRGERFMLLMVGTPEGRVLAVGRDENGPWAIRPDGGVERDHPEIAWPKWASVGDESLFADSPDRLLEVLSKGYTMARRGSEELDGHAGRKYEHLVGEKKGRFLPGPSRIELWIDSSSKVVQRIEMRWDDRDAPRPQRPGPGGARRPEFGPQGRPIDGMPPMRPGDDRADPDRPPTDGDAAQDARHEDQQIEDGAPTDRPPRRARQGPGPMGGFGGPPIGPGPGGGGGPFRPSPPRLLVIELVDAPVFAEGWFTPATHTQP